jgi:hypothetical protein
LCLPSCLFPSRSATKILHAFLFLLLKRATKIVLVYFFCFRLKNLMSKKKHSSTGRILSPFTLLTIDLLSTYHIKTWTKQYNAKQEKSEHKSAYILHCQATNHKKLTI